MPTTQTVARLEKEVAALKVRNATFQVAEDAPLSRGHSHRRMGCWHFRLRSVLFAVKRGQLTEIRTTENRKLVVARVAQARMVEARGGPGVLSFGQIMDFGPPGIISSVPPAAQRDVLQISEKCSATTDQSARGSTHASVVVQKGCFTTSATACMRSSSDHLFPDFLKVHNQWMSVLKIRLVLGSELRHHCLHCGHGLNATSFIHVNSVPFLSVWNYRFQMMKSCPVTKILTRQEQIYLLDVSKMSEHESWSSIWWTLRRPRQSFARHPKEKRYFFSHEQFQQTLCDPFDCVRGDSASTTGTLDHVGEKMMLSNNKLQEGGMSLPCKKRLTTSTTSFSQLTST